MTIELQTPDEADHLAEGTVTIRDYFAARAPAEVPEWFEPVPYTRLVEPPIPDDLDPVLARSALQYDEPDGLGEGQVQYWHAYHAARAEQRAAHNLKTLRRQIRWAFAWADAMLRERAKGGVS